MGLFPSVPFRSFYFHCNWDDFSEKYSSYCRLLQILYLSWVYNTWFFFYCSSNLSQIMIVCSLFFFAENFMCTQKIASPIMMTCVGVLNFAKSWRASVISPCNFKNQPSSFFFSCYLFFFQR